MSAAWYYLKNREQVGPVSEDQLAELVAQKQLVPTDLVWRQGMSSWASAGEALPGLFSSSAPPLPETSSSPGLVGRLVKMVPGEEWRGFLEDSLEAWRALSGGRKLLVILIVVAVAIVSLCVYIPRALASGGEPGLLARLWDGGFLLGLASFLLRGLIAFVKRPATVATSSGQVAVLPVAPHDSSGVLRLSERQWLVLLVALFIPTLLVSLLSSVLVGSQVHLWLSGPILALVGVVIFVLGRRLDTSEESSNLTAWSLVGLSGALVWFLTLCNTQWVLLFYTLVVIVPAIHLLTLAHRGTPPIRLNPPLLATFVVWGLVIFIGVALLPRASDASDRLVGTWTNDKGDMLRFTKGGTVSWGDDGRRHRQVARYKFDGRTLAIHDDGGEGEYQVEMVSADELLVGNTYTTRNAYRFGNHIALEGRWTKGERVADAGKDKRKEDRDPKIPPPPPGGEDVTDADPPNLKSPLAPKLVGAWQGTGGKTAGHVVRFTKSGRVEFSHPDSLSKGKTETALGSYSFKKDDLMELKQAGGIMSGKWQVEVEFVSEDEILLVNHGSQYGGFGPLAGRYKRSK